MRPDPSHDRSYRRPKQLQQARSALARATSAQLALGLFAAVFFLAACITIFHGHSSHSSAGTPGLAADSWSGAQQGSSLPLSSSSVYRGASASTLLSGASLGQSRSSLPPVNVCILSADFWGLKEAGGTATAYHLLANMADFLLSPTAYMLAALRQRGWTLPAARAVLPNILPTAEAPMPTQRLARPVWRVAFFGRLEERKGIKLFMEAVSKVDFAKHPRFEVYMVGSDSTVGMFTSRDYLEQASRAWPWPTHILTDLSRAAALQTIQQEGMLLVMASLIENMPFVVAEAAVLQVPFLVLDVGGISEMLDPTLHADTILQQPFAPNLAAKLLEVLDRGQLETAVLSAAITTGKEQWALWHAAFQADRPARTAQDLQRREKVAQPVSKPAKQLLVVRMPAGAPQPSLSLKQSLCQGAAGLGGRKFDYNHVLLMPPGFDFLHSTATPQQLEVLADIAFSPSQPNAPAALTFGAVLPTNVVGYASSPTWTLYDGKETNCSESVPVLLPTDTFCDAFLAESGDFKVYTSWTLSTMLRQAGLTMHTFPEAMFRVTAWTASGANCQLTAIPARNITHQVAANMYTDAEDLLRNLHMAPWPKPLASLRQDFLDYQGHRGWQFYFTDPRGRPAGMQWSNEDSQAVLDGRWGCEAYDYPSMHKFLLHPCASTGSPGCCGGTMHSNAAIRLRSNFKAEPALAIVAFEVYPVCGDGLDVSVVWTPRATGKAQTLYSWAFDPVKEGGQPYRQQFQYELAAYPGDALDVVADARGNHACDGVYIVDLQLWAADQSTSLQ
ncbi:hypothetical protein WJX72_006158 [[Myrmecia] bisecta]|uniref:Glycosyl transferase family 1 domain-containing protein n=1 Tax=[Myrmecia] bisecta TaxID=41462 RepID=A0AAW1PK69_9CHLO